MPRRVYMVGVAQLVELRIVTPAVEGSIPFVHPIFTALNRIRALQKQVAGFFVSVVLFRFFCFDR